MSKIVDRIRKGLFSENPVLVQVLGMCPTLAVTTSAENGLGMGLATTAVLILSNFVISILRNIIPTKVRIPAFIVVIATFVTIIEFVLAGFVPDLYDSLGLFIPLIVVNCIVLGRAEAFASKNGAIVALADGLGMGLGFALSLTILGSIRELLGAGIITLFGKTIVSIASFYTPVTIFILAPGAFIVLGFMFAAFNYFHERSKKA